jgi:L-threonylcarbamoyladenylate synthase
MRNYEDDIEQCLKILKNGGIILYPTDTIWGIGCDATNAEAVHKVYKLKKRKDEKSLIVLVADEKDILRHVTQPDLEVFDYLKLAKKPTTVVYEGAIGFADDLVGKDGSVAIRICKEEFCKHLIKRFRKPIVSTSANISGQQFPENFKGISAEIKKGVDYIVSYRQDDSTRGEPSALIRWQKRRAIVIRP